MTHKRPFKKSKTELASHAVAGFVERMAKAASKGAETRLENAIAGTKSVATQADGAQPISTNTNTVQLYGKKRKKSRRKKPTKFVTKVRKALEKSSPMNVIYQWSNEAIWATAWPAGETANQIVKGADIGYTLGGNVANAFPHTYITSQIANVGWVEGVTAKVNPQGTIDMDYIVKMSKIDLVIKLKNVTINTATCVLLDIYECISTNSHTSSNHLTPYNTWDTLDAATEPGSNSAGDFSGKGITPWQCPGFGKYWSILKKTRLRLTALEPHNYQMIGVPGFYSGKETSSHYCLKGKTKGLLFVICGEPYLTGIANTTNLLDIMLNRTVHYKLPNGQSLINQTNETMGLAPQYVLTTT